MARRSIAVSALLLSLLASLATPARGDDFLGDGFVLDDPTEGDDYANALAVGGDAFYVAGSDSASTPGRWRVEKRRLEDGAPAPGFGDGGTIVVDLPGTLNAVTALVVDGRSLFVVGHADGRLRIEKRRTADGRRRRRFGHRGVVEFPGEDVVGQSSRTALVAGPHLYVGTERGRVLKLRTEDGAVQRFDAPGAPGVSVTSLAARGGALYLATATPRGFGFEKRGLQTGRLLRSLPVPVAPTGCIAEGANALAVVDGTLLAGGGRKVGSWYVERRDARNGALLWEVERPGIDCAAVEDIVVTGDSFFAVGQRNFRLFIEKRRLADGALVEEFGNAGDLRGPLPQYSARAAANVCGDLVVAGTMIWAEPRPAGTAWFVRRVHPATGAPVVTPRAGCAGQISD